MREKDFGNVPSGVSGIGEKNQHIRFQEKQILLCTELMV